MAHIQGIYLKELSQICASAYEPRILSHSRRQL